MSAATASQRTSRDYEAQGLHACASTSQFNFLGWPGPNPLKTVLTQASAGGLDQAWYTLEEPLVFSFQTRTYSGDSLHTFVSAELLLDLRAYLFRLLEATFSLLLALNSYYSSAEIQLKASVQDHRSTYEELRRPQGRVACAPWQSWTTSRSWRPL